MARPLYSTLLWEETSYSGLFTESDTVPAGVVWVVRDACFWAPVQEGQRPLLGAELTDSNGAPIWGKSFPYAQQNYLYQWQGRQVLESGDLMIMTLGESFWSWRISGYVLTV